MKKSKTFFLSIKHQIWRRFYYLFFKKEITETIKNRKGECKRCGGCCNASIKCANLYYNEKGHSCCFINKTKPHLCELYPFNHKDFFDHLRDKCGFEYEVKMDN